MQEPLIIPVPETCDGCPIRHQAVCAKSTPHELAALQALRSYKFYKKGQTVVWAGAEITHLGSIISGSAILNRTLEDGRFQIVGLLLPSDFIGRPDRRVVPYDIVAVTDLTVCQFELTAFEDLLIRSPAMMRQLLKKTSDELDAAREWMIVLGRKTAREKTASFLSLLVKHNLDEFPVQSEQVQISLPLSRAEMADFLGMSLETTSRQMSQLKQNGVIELVDKRDIIIRDLATLMDEAGEDNDGGLPS